jgi:transposase
LLERVLAGRRTALREAAATVDHAAKEQDPPEDKGSTVRATAPGRRRAQERQDERRAHRLARYDAVVALHQQGHSHSAISRQTGLGQRTVHRYLRAGAFPELAVPPMRPTMLAPYEPYFRMRWAEGCHNARELWQEIQSQGFLGQPAIVRRLIARWRPQPGRPGPSIRKTVAGDMQPMPPARPPTPRKARWILLRTVETLTPEELAYRTVLLAADPAIREAQQLADDFGTMVRTRDQAALAGWLERAEASGQPEIRSFAAGLRRDQPAVEAALRSVWSNGQTEGQVNRLKTLKRQMYGRANLDLLRTRFLYAA